MSSNARDRRAKIEAVAPGRGGPNRLVVATVVAVLAIVAVVGGVIIANQGAKGQASAGGSELPKGAATMGAGLVVNPGAPATVPTIDLYEDFQCPVCKQFEQLFGAKIETLARENKVKLVVHTLSFLDDNLRNDSSNRAANAAACADDQGVFLAFHKATFAGQPEREGTGYTDADLKGFAEAAGVTGDKLTAWQQCYDERAHNKYVVSVQAQADKDGVRGTPTIRLDGKDLELQTLSEQSLNAAVKAATK